MERRIAPSAKIEAAIEEVLLGGLDDADRVGELGRLGAQLVLQRAVEEEVTAFLGRVRYERAPEATGSRNGTRPRRVQTAEGEISVAMPQVRDSLTRFVSATIPDTKAIVRTRPLEALVIGAYVRGLSDRDIESLAAEAGLGHISRTTVSTICRELRDRYRAFRARSLGEVRLLALMLDAIYLPVRPEGPKEGKQGDSEQSDGESHPLDATGPDPQEARDEGRPHRDHRHRCGSESGADTDILCDSHEACPADHHECRDAGDVPPLSSGRERCPQRHEHEEHRKPCQGIAQSVEDEGWEAVEPESDGQVRGAPDEVHRTEGEGGGAAAGDEAPHVGGGGRASALKGPGFAGQIFLGQNPHLLEGPIDAVGTVGEFLRLTERQWPRARQVDDDLFHDATWRR